MTKLNLGGKERGFSFNQYAISLIAERSRGDNTLASLYAIVWGGINGYDYAKGLDVDYNFENVIDWVDQATMAGETFESIVNELVESQSWKHLMKQGEENKKKVTKKLKPNA